MHAGIATIRPSIHKVCTLNLKLTIAIFDELDEEIIKSTGTLDLASGEINGVQYIDYDVTAKGLPVERDDYAFTSGTLTHEGKDVEFRVEADPFGKYSVSPTELLDIKVRAARLFAGIEGKDLLAGASKQGAAKPATQASGKPPVLPRKKLH